MNEIVILQDFPSRIHCFSPGIQINGIFNVLEICHSERESGGILVSSQPQSTLLADNYLLVPYHNDYA